MAGGARSRQRCYIAWNHWSHSLVVGPPKTEGGNDFIAKPSISFVSTVSPEAGIPRHHARRAPPYGHTGDGNTAGRRTHREQVWTDSGFEKAKAGNRVMRILRGARTSLVGCETSTSPRPCFDVRWGISTRGGNEAGRAGSAVPGTSHDRRPRAVTVGIDGRCRGRRMTRIRYVMAGALNSTQLIRLFRMTRRQEAGILDPASARKLTPRSGP